MFLFNEDEIRGCVSLNHSAIEQVEEGFTQLGHGQVVLPPMMRIDIPEHHGEVDVKTAYIKGLDTFAIKVSSGFFENKALGLPSLSGMMILLRSVTGVPEAVLMDNGYLTDIRTACAGAIAAKYLAKAHVETAGVIGTGLQARLQMEALHMMRPFKRLLVYGRRAEAVDAYIGEMSEKLGIVCETAAAEEVVRQSDVVVTTTPSREPIVQQEWLHEGLHITAMGADTELKQELDAEVFRKADLIVCDVKAQCLKYGEVHHAADYGVLQHEDARMFELGALTAKTVPGRENDRQITLCDLTGTGVQDTAIARYAFERLMKMKTV
ncbi:cyclodeaminase [Sporolactobacillus inulinus]|uniref:cyclodeaminase n=1 Tax=Sporolactobacillus inulinus TaxID=2078 RepID=UPI001144FDE8|nr:cyclodeaminase [Sporolactobacillus inulinus]GEB76326.1 cyclodeaminase [Sporolactobacillus inulinus]